MRKRVLLAAILLSSCFSLWIGPSLAAQAPATGNVEFTARMMPSGGRFEPVRGLTFYLLRKSLDDIRLEAEKADPPPDMDRFIDSQESSPELKAWMKKHHTVNLQGTEFTSHLTGDEIVGVKEFLDAYAALNGGTHSGGFPEPKYKESDKTKNPEKYEREHAQYVDAMRRFVQANPDSLAGLDALLADKNPGRRWGQIVGEQRERAERRALQLAQSVYLAGETESGFDGRGSFAALAPGAYWLTTLDTPALAGDVRLRWNLPVTVHAGERALVDLSNANAIEPPAPPAL
jgi:hypothetical protein